jgi:hypothetical protein
LHLYDHYRLLKTRSLKELVEHDNEMIGAVRTLDTDMQNLVYLNYNKCR